MKRNLIRTTILASLPIVFLAAAAHARQIQVYLSVDGVPAGDGVRQCSNHMPIDAVAFESDFRGNQVSADAFLECNISSQASGTTASTLGRPDIPGGGCSAISQLHHRVQIVDLNSDLSQNILCQGTDMISGGPASTAWDSDLSTGRNVTTCTVPPTSGLRVQFSTDGGKHYGNCSNPTMQAFSIGTE